MSQQKTNTGCFFPVKPPEESMVEGSEKMGCSPFFLVSILVPPLVPSSTPASLTDSSPHFQK